MREVQDAALAEHHVEVQLLGEPLPQLDRVIVDPGALVPQVIGADDRRVAPGVAAAEPALFEHGHVAHAVLLGQVVGGRQTMAAGADDDHLIARLRLRAAPDGSPVVVATPSVAGERPDRIALHGVSSQQSLSSLPFCQSPSGDASDDRRLCWWPDAAPYGRRMYRCLRELSRESRLVVLSAMPKLQWQKLPSNGNTARLGALNHRRRCSIHRGRDGRLSDRRHWLVGRRAGRAGKALRCHAGRPRRGVRRDRAPGSDAREPPCSGRKSKSWRCAPTI